MFLGQTLNDYQFVRFLGEGAFSLVFAATHLPSGTEVAIKVLNLRATPDQLHEFQNEERLLVKMSGAEHVVDIYDSQVAQMDVVLQASGLPTSIDVHFHVLELADGSVDHLVAQLGNVPWGERLALYRDLVLGVHQMHSNAIVHRDLKSANCLLIAKRMNVILAKVSDLGRARDLTEDGVASILHYRVGRGDRSYAPPEMIWCLGKDDPLSHRLADLYGLGSLLFEFTTGQGITSLALAPQYSLIQFDLRLPEDQRKRQFGARQNEVRAWFETAYVSAGPEIPKEIRFETLTLLRQLCDPDPMSRLPKIAPGQRLRLPTDLNWLLRRIDILIKRLEAMGKSSTQKRIGKAAR
jgi:serine/threonine protein kinase